MRDIAAAALEAHRHLDEEIERLKNSVSLEGKQTPEDWFRDCAEHFRRFHTHLRSHIDMEESGGFLEPVRQRRPTLTPRVEQLRKEHRQMIDICVEIERSLLDCKKPAGTDVHALHAKIDDLLHELEKHEAFENKLIQEVFSQDIGAGD